MCIRDSIKDGKISFAELPEIEPHVRDVFLLWLSKALENKHFRGKTESGEIYYIENADTKETCMLPVSYTHLVGAQTSGSEPSEYADQYACHKECCAGFVRGYRKS